MPDRNRQMFSLVSIAISEKNMILSEPANNMDRVTVKDIARELNISPGTVSKALNGKKGVRKQTRDMVAEMARKSGYSINRTAQSLSRKPVNVSIVLPDVWKEIYGYIRYGIEIELGALHDNKICGSFYFYSNMFSSMEIRERLTSFLDAGTDAVILCPTHIHDYADCLDALYDKKIKTVIVLGSAVKEGGRFADIRIDSDMSGSMAAEYASLLCQKHASAAVFLGNKDLEEHRQKAVSFQRVAAEKSFPVSGVYETQDNVDIAYTLTKKVLAEQPGLGVIYVATSNSVAVCRCILDMGADSRVRVIATDIFPGMIPYVQSGLIAATIYQNPIRMGRMAVKTIYDTGSSWENPYREIFVYPQLILKSNYSVYAEYLQKAEEGMDVDINNA